MGSAAGDEAPATSPVGLDHTDEEQTAAAPPSAPHRPGGCSAYDRPARGPAAGAACCPAHPQQSPARPGAACRGAGEDARGPGLAAAGAVAPRGVRRCGAGLSCSFPADTAAMDV